MKLEHFLIILMPLVGTALGSLLVFICKGKLNNKFEKLMLGFASGVMIAASFFSLILPSLEMSKTVFIPSLGFIIGVVLLLLLDSLLPHLHHKAQTPEGVKSKFKEHTMMFFAVTLHNIPEGMTVGVMISGLLLANETISLVSATILALGIALQNIPEGMIVAFDYKAKGHSNLKSFVYGFLSGVVEPLGSLLMIAFSSLLTSILPLFLTLAAGSMIYVVVEELVPSLHDEKHSNLGTVGVMLGFVIMMILDVALG